MLKLKSLIKKEDGQAMILVVIVFTVLLGFSALVIDYGYLSLQKRELQNAADAAALAGVVDLSLEKDDEYEATVIKYVKKNSTLMKDIPGTDIKNYVSTEWDQSSNELTVTINYEYDLFFGNIFDFSKSNVTASATANWKEVTVDSGNGENNNNIPDGSNDKYKNKIFPIAIMEEDLNNFLNQESDPEFGKLGIIALNNFNNLGDDSFGFFGYYTTKRNEEIAAFYDDDAMEDWYENKKADSDDSPTNFPEVCAKGTIPLAYYNEKMDVGKAKVFIGDEFKDYKDIKKIISESKKEMKEIEDRMEKGKDYNNNQRIDLVTVLIPVVEHFSDDYLGFPSVKVKYFIKAYIRDFIDVSSSSDKWRGLDKRIDSDFKYVEDKRVDWKKKLSYLKNYEVKRTLVVSFTEEKIYNLGIEGCPIIGEPGNGNTETKIVYRLIK